MKAFVKTTKGTFPNVNFYLAWEAFNTLGYSVTCFEEEDIGALDITPATPVFAGVGIFRKVIDKLGINYPPHDCYPDNLKDYYKRRIWRSTLGEERAKFNKDGEPVFVKPVLPKQFLGHVWRSIINLIPLANVSDDARVYCSDPIVIDSEFRVYVHDGEILGVKHYFGDWSLVPDKQFIKDSVKAYQGPIAYGIDIGVNKNWGSFVIETNDGCNLGNYGLDSIHYGEMIVARWFEIMADSDVSSYIAKEIEEERKNGYTPKTYTFSDGSTMESQSVKEIYFKPWEHTKIRCYKDALVKKAATAGRQKSMAAFAKEVQQKIKEENSISQINWDEFEEDKQLTAAIESVPLTVQTAVLNMSPSPITGRMRQLIGNYTIDRDEFWKLTDAERQALHDKHAPGTKAPAFDPRFAEKYGKNPNGPF